jgi:hypothetical protein
MPDSPLKQLDVGQWAWEFLRRNPAYQADYREFIALWQALEADYGAPPNRDYPRWKNDPRASRPAWDPSLSSGAACAADDEDKQLIECWMGAKWGFRKFPLDPAINLPEELTWREFPIDVEVIDAHTGAEPPRTPEKLTLRFDLSLPLPAQLEAAKRQLIAARQLRAKTGSLPPRNLREGVSIWRLWLRLLDALDAGASINSIAETLALSNPARDATAAIAMRSGGYRRILMLAH